MTLFIWFSAFAFLGLTAWGSYRYHAGRNSAPLPWRTITVDTLIRTVPVMILTVTVTSLMSLGQA